MSETAVKLEQVSKYYKLYDSPRDRLKEALYPFGKKRHREFYALKNIDLEVKKGELLGIVGRNGSGKSTLLQLIANVIPANAGRITSSGKISTLLDLNAGLNPDLDGIQNIFFGGLMHGFSHEEIKAKVDEIVAFAEIGDFIYQPLKTYSSGMKARLGFALAISIQPKILVVDEVLSVGDDLFKRKCFAKMEEFFKSGCTVFFVSHSTANIVEICTRAILLDKGELILDGSPNSVTMNYLRLMFAKRDEQGAIRDELVRLNRGGKEKTEFPAASESVATPRQKNETVVVPPHKKEMPSRQEAFYIANFNPKSTVIAKNCDIDIYDPQLLTLDGRKVNVLVALEEYFYSYKVKFGTEIDRVNFGMGFKNEKGLVLSWMVYPGVNRYVEKAFLKGESYCIRWQFKCLFMPGTYFVDSGLRTSKNSEMITLIKISDLIAFKVQNSKDRQKGGIFDSFGNVKIEKI